MVIELCRSMWHENLSKIRLIFWSFICAWFLWAETVFWLFTYLDVFGWYFLMCMSIWCLYADIFAYKLHSLIINLFLNQVFFFFPLFFALVLNLGAFILLLNQVCLQKMATDAQDREQSATAALRTELLRNESMQQLMHALKTEQTQKCEQALSSNYCSM